VGSSTDLVAADYYEQELRFQGQLDRVKRAQSLPVKATASYDDATRTIRIALPPDHAAARGEIHFYRPSTAGLDQRTALQLDATGTQSLDAAKLRPGLWKVKVLWTAASQDYAFEETIIVGAKNF
jgi:nitrogen fixation protein FixH